MQTRVNKFMICSLTFCFIPLWKPLTTVVKLSFLLTTAWTPYFLGEKRHKRLAWWHFLCCDLQSKLQPRQVAYSNKIANDSGKKKPKTFWKRSERGRRDAYVLEKSLGPIMHAFLTTNSFIFDWQLIIIQSFCLVMNPNCKCCSINPSVQGPNSRRLHNNCIL